MVIEVNTNFVSNRLIYVNMSNKEAKKNNVLEEFNFANTDGDDKISEKEYAEYLKKTCSAEIKITDVEYGAQPHRYVTLLENTQIDFYPGLKFANVPVEAKEHYKLIDLDKDNKLSDSEIADFNKVRGLFEKAKEEIREKCDEHGIKMGSSGLLGIAGALGGAYLALSGPIGLAIAGVSALGSAGYMFYEAHNYKKECKEIEEELLKQTNNHPYILEHLKDINFYYD